MRAVAALTLSLALACGPKQPPPVSAYQSGDRAAALERQKTALAEAHERDRALEALRLASMAYAQGDPALSEQALRKAVAVMTDFQAQGEFAAVIAAESRKEWKGEPYEKMAAYLMLGAMLHAEGDRGNALAMYKSSVLADTGTAEERFRSDFAPGWVLQALAYQAEGEDENARQFMARGIDSVVSRHTLQVLTQAMDDVSTEGLETETADLARAVLLTSMSAGVTAKPRDAQEAVRATLGHASTLILDQKDRPKKERMPAFGGFSPRDFKQAAEALPAMSERWSAGVAATGIVLPERSRIFVEKMEGLLDSQPNVLLLVERGRGPRKMREGEHGQILKIIPNQRPEFPPEIYAGEQVLGAVWLDSLSYQATTRGGRKVDGFLQGKAIYKDTSFVTGYLLLEVASALADADQGGAAAAAAVIGLVAMISSAAANPEADIRQWEFVPEGYYLVAETLPPGEHALSIDNRAYSLKVPATGQVMGLLSAVAPGGPLTIE